MTLIKALHACWAQKGLQLVIATWAFAFLRRTPASGAMPNTSRRNVAARSLCSYLPQFLAPKLLASLTGVLDVVLPRYIKHREAVLFGVLTYNSWFIPNLILPIYPSAESPERLRTVQWLNRMAGAECMAVTGLGNMVSRPSSCLCICCHCNVGQVSHCSSHATVIMQQRSKNWCHLSC